MSIASVTEIIAASPKNFEDAVENGIARANKTLHNVQGAWVESQKVECDEQGKITEYRVALKVTFVLDD
jgi:hypothetical protein